MANATLTPQELGAIIDIAANASVPLGQAHKMHDVVNRALTLAQQPYTIGAIVPQPEVATGDDAYVPANG